MQELERPVRIWDCLLDVGNGGEDAGFGAAGEVDCRVDAIEDTGEFFADAGGCAGDNEDLGL
jgi:hypothetical protein